MGFSWVTEGALEAEHLLPFRLKSVSMCWLLLQFEQLIKVQSGSREIVSASLFADGGDDLQAGGLHVVLRISGEFI